MDKRIAKAILDTSKANPNLSVETLVYETAESLGVRRYEVAKHLYQIWRDGNVKLIDLQPPSTLAQYVKSIYSLWFWALTALVMFTALAVYLLPQIPPYIYLRYAVGSVFVLYLPGFVLIEALYPKREYLTPLERLVLSIGLSLALVPLIGLVLNYTLCSLTLDLIFLSLAFLTMTLAAVAVSRKFAYFEIELVKQVKKKTLR